MSRVPDKSPSPQPSPIKGEQGSSSSKLVQVDRSRDGKVEYVTDRVAQETPIALRYNGVPQVVMMATPADLEDLAVGFTVTEAIATTDEIRTISIAAVQDGVQVDLQIAAEPFSKLLQRQRNLTGRTGCGVCGVESIEQAIRPTKRIAADLRIGAKELHETLRTLADRQFLNRVVGSVHGAAWAKASEQLSVVREDVGRHNALDKTIGALLRAQIDPASGYLIITSRASYEMVLKAAMVGVSLLVAVSAPTALAIDLAQQSGMTLVGFAREHSHVIYSHAERVVE
jgi:FdhD protein